MLDTSEFFNYFFRNSRYNGLLVMDKTGVILEVNEAFTQIFGYTTADLVGSSFHRLFTETDRRLGKPNQELASVLANGSANDDNYLLNSDGTASWVTGESIYCKTKTEEEYIIKVIHNIQMQKLLEQMLMESNELVESIFHSITDVGLLLLDARMKPLKANDRFFSMFSLEADAMVNTKKLAELPAAFWQDDEVRATLREMIVANDFFRNKTFDLNRYGIGKTLAIYAKPLEGQRDAEKKILLVIREIELNVTQANAVVS